MGTARATIKLVVVGDSGVGKTSMLISYTKNLFPDGFNYPLVFDSYSKIIDVKGVPYCLAIWDTPGGPAYDRLRPLSYPQTSVFLVCFSIDSPASYENVCEKWFPEANHYCPGVPCVLAATKIDLRGDSQVIEALAKKRRRLFTTEQGQRLAWEMKAAKYVECSALTQEGLKNVFGQVCVSAVAVENLELVAKKKTRCVVV
ncbi:cell division control protein 42 [Mycena pura]|uniref:Cell division control protein 42 n=1 Tax=Mycena pura TaxID=153505 RepID=A0AAD6VV43_9AGAR|nr:cell division control protein 42 [Mycena pura]